MSALGIALSVSKGGALVDMEESGGGPLPSGFDPEEGLTLTGTIPAGASDVDTGATFQNQDPIVIAFDVTGLDGTGGGLIFEAGGTGSGIYIGYRSNGDFVARVGDGTAPWSAGTSYLLLPAASAPSGDGTLALSYDTIIGSLQVWWNGEALSGIVNGTAGQWGGTGSTTNYLSASTSAPLGEEITTVATYTTASGLRYYSDQFVGDLLTDGLVQTGSIPVGTDDFNVVDLARTDPIVIATTLTGLDGSAGGMIFEMGGSGQGVYAGFRGTGDFVARAFNGAAVPNADTAAIIVPAASAPSGSGRLVLQIDPVDGSIEAYWNGVELAAPGTATPGGQWAGSGPGDYLIDSNNGPVGEVLTSVAYTSATPLVLYEGQRIGDVFVASPGYGVVTFDDGATPSVQISGSGGYDGTYTTLAGGGTIQSITWMRANGPQCILAPQITGTVADGATITATPGLWVAAADAASGDDLPGVALTGQWQADGSDIPGETGLTVTVPAGTTSITFVETATQPTVAQASQNSNTLT